MTKKRAFILLSGGLDSLVALDIITKQDVEVKALFFDYNQKSRVDELKAVKKIAKRYSIEYKIVKLPFLANITNNSLVNPNRNNFDELKEVWVPNRNGLFLNIAASYCDSFNYDYIVFGANKEESKSFTDNKSEYVDILNKAFEYSTMKHPLVIAPCCDMTKVDLVNYMIDNDISFELIKSCYKDTLQTGKKHCMQCMSCRLLYNAIINSKKPEIAKEIF